MPKHARRMDSDDDDSDSISDFDTDSFDDVVRSAKAADKACYQMCDALESMPGPWYTRHSIGAVFLAIILVKCLLSLAPASSIKDDVSNGVVATLAAAYLACAALSRVTATPAKRLASRIEAFRAVQASMTEDDRASEMSALLTAYMELTST